MDEKEKLELSWSDHAGYGYGGYTAKLGIAETGEIVKITVAQDDDAESPREWDNLSTFVCWCRRYNLGDEQPSADPHEYLKDMAFGLDPDLENRVDYWLEGNGWARIWNTWGNYPAHSAQVTSEAMAKARAAIQAVLDRELAALVPLYLYDHSGITMSARPFSCPWDSGQVGFAYITREDALRAYSPAAREADGYTGKSRLSKRMRERAAKAILGEVETYDHYLTNNVHGYSVEVTRREHCECCKHDEFVEVASDSCWGYYGDPDESGLLDDLNDFLEPRGITVTM